VLREHDLPVSSAHVIEAVRLAGDPGRAARRPLAGLAEVSEATRAVLCDGDELAAGSSPGPGRRRAAGHRARRGARRAAGADLRAQARSLRLKVEPLARKLSLDLRKDLDRDRSVLLQPASPSSASGWGVSTEDAVRSTGTFRET